MIARDPRSTLELYLKEFRRPPEELDSMAIPPHVPIGGFLNRNRSIDGYYMDDDLVMYESPHPHSAVVFRDSAYKWSGYSELSGDGYLVRSHWNVLEYTPQWVKVQYRGFRGWIDGRYFAANKIVVFNLGGRQIGEFLSPYVTHSVYTIAADADSASIFVSNYKDFYLKIQLSTGQVLDTVRAGYLIDHGLLKSSYIHTRLNMPEEDFATLYRMKFYPGTFEGTFLQDRVIYLCENEGYENALVSEGYQTGRIDTLFHFNRFQIAVVYQIESICPIGKHVLMSMNPYDARY